jgi:hypothetical protein
VAAGSRPGAEPDRADAVAESPQLRPERQRRNRSVRRRANHFVLSECMPSNVKSVREKYLSSVFRKDVVLSAGLVLTRGALRIVINVERGMRWTRAASPDE